MDIFQYFFTIFTKLNRTVQHLMAGDSFMPA